MINDGAVIGQEHWICHLYLSNMIYLSYITIHFKPSGLSSW